MKPSKLIPPLLAYAAASLYLIGGFIESLHPDRVGVWRQALGPLAIDLGSDPALTGKVMLGLDMVLFVLFILYVARLKRLEQEAETHGKVTQDQG